MGYEHKRDITIIHEYKAICDHCGCEYNNVYITKYHMKSDIIKDGWRYVSSIEKLLCNDCRIKYEKTNPPRRRLLAYTKKDKEYELRQKQLRQRQRDIKNFEKSLKNE